MPFHSLQISSAALASAGKKVGQEFLDRRSRRSSLSHPDVEVFGGGRFDHVVIELHVDRRAGILVPPPKAIHGRLRAGGRPVLKCNSRHTL